MTEAASATLRYLPPYGRDPKPIAKASAKLKAILCKAADRTVGDLEHATSDALPAFSSRACENYFADVGYEPERSDFALAFARNGRAV